MASNRNGCDGTLIKIGIGQVQHIASRIIVVGKVTFNMRNAYLLRTFIVKHAPGNIGSRTLDTGRNSRPLFYTTSGYRAEPGHRAPKIPAPISSKRYPISHQSNTSHSIVSIEKSVPRAADNNHMSQETKMMPLEELHMSAFNRESHLTCKKALQLLANKLMPPAARKLESFFWARRSARSFLFAMSCGAIPLFRYDLYQAYMSSRTPSDPAAGRLWCSITGHSSGGMLLPTLMAARMLATDSCESDSVPLILLRRSDVAGDLCISQQAFRRDNPLSWNVVLSRTFFSPGTNFAGKRHLTSCE